MPDELKNSDLNFGLKRVRQKTSYNCAPAVVEMLLSHYGFEVSQDQIIEASGVTNKNIKTYGMVIGDLARAVHRIVPQMNFWYKTDSTISELKEIVRNCNYPVGINWQGVFPDEDDYSDGGFSYEEEDDDEGHFSVVVDVDTEENYIKIVDPYGRYAGKDRTFSIVEFEKRWWDEDWEIMPDEKKRRYIYYPKMMFVILPPLINFPMGLKMKKL